MTLKVIGTLEAKDMRAEGAPSAFGKLCSNPFISNASEIGIAAFFGGKIETMNHDILRPLDISQFH